MASRRDFLSVLAGSGLAISGIPLSRLEAQLPPDGIRLDRETKRLVGLIDRTKRETCQELLVNEMRRGVPYRQLLAAVFMYAALRDGHHSVYLIHSTHQLSLELSAEDRMLPLFWAIDVAKEHFERSDRSPVLPIKGPFPKASEADAEFHVAMDNMDREKAEHAIIAVCRSQGARQAYAKFLPYACRDNYFIGHIPIGVASAGRALETIGWHHAEPTLRYIVRDMYRQDHNLDGQPYRHNVERAEKTYRRLPVGWASHEANKQRTIELLGLMKKGKWWNTNDWVAEHLIDGSIKAGTVWDAIHLLAAELMLLLDRGGSIGSRALHSNTSANALHYAFANCLDSHARYQTMLQAVSWATEFMLEARSRDGIREGDVATMQPVDWSGNIDDTIGELLAALPPRIFLEKDDDRTGQLKAAELTFAMTQSPQGAIEFMNAAQHGMARRLSLNAHEMKYPIAMFEEFRRVSPEWRPHLLAATSVFLQGTNSQNNPAVQRGAELLAQLH